MEKREPSLEAVMTLLEIMKRQLDEMGNPYLPELLTPNEAAEYLNVKSNTLAIWRTQGIGPGFRKIEKVIRYPKDELKKYLEQQTVISH